MRHVTPYFEIELPGWQPHPHASSMTDFGAVNGPHELIVSTWLMHRAPDAPPDVVLARFVAHRRSVLEQAGASKVIEVPADWRDGDAMAVLYGSLPDRHFFVTTTALAAENGAFHSTVTVAFYRYGPIASYDELTKYAVDATASLAVKRS